MNEETIEKRDQAVITVREELHRLVKQSKRTQREIEQENGYARGYLSQVLHGHMSLTVRHVFGILLSLEISPEQFFTRIFSEGTLEWSGIGEIRERLARYDSAIRELEDKGLLSSDE